VELVALDATVAAVGAGAEGVVPLAQALVGAAGQFHGGLKLCIGDSAPVLG